MAKKNRPTPAVNLTCNLCMTKGHSIPGSTHRRCGRSEGAPLKDKDAKAPRGLRGVWG